MNAWIEGLSAVVEPTVLVMILVGVVLGVVIGAIPGLSATVGMALFLPFAFSLDPLSGLVLLLGIYNGACYSAAIPAVLLRTPGTPASAATVFDGYPMTLNGQAGRALTISLYASVFGGLVGALLLSTLSPFLASYARNFGSPEYFAIAILALTIVASIGGDAPLWKGVIAASIGLLLVSVGFDPVAGFPRLSFGNTQLASGLGLIPLLVGLFGVAEALLQIQRHISGAKSNRTLGKFRLGKGGLRNLAPTLLGSTGVGFGTGLLPGVGGDVGAFMAYNETKRFAKNSAKFGKGDERGVAAAESANNASNMGSLVSTFSLGIPGNAQAAVLLGVLLIAGIQPGPGLFESSPDLVFGSFIAMTIAFLLLLPIGIIGIRFWARVVQINPTFLWPFVLVFCIIGSYSVRTNTFDVIVTLGAGVLGFLLTRYGYPVAPVLIAVLVGPLAEENYRRAVINNGGGINWMFEPLPLAILIVALVAVAASLIRDNALINKLIMRKKQ